MKRALGRGQLELREGQDAYLRPGRFDRQDIIGLLQEIAIAGEQLGPGVTRLRADMQWVAEESLDVREMVRYEAELNGVLPRHDMAAVCSYDVTRLRSSVVMDILRTHPFVSVGGALRQSPFYVQPDEFLRELNERVRLPAEHATVARSQLFILAEGIDYTVDAEDHADHVEKGGASFSRKGSTTPR